MKIHFVNLLATYGVKNFALKKFYALAELLYGAWKIERVLRVKKVIYCMPKYGEKGHFYENLVLPLTLFLGHCR
jgi:hypothetical protein